MSTATLPTAAGRSRPTPTALDVAFLLDDALDGGVEPPCRTHDPDLWFAESGAELEEAKRLCAGCPVRTPCLAAAIARREPCGVWGGEIFHHGAVLPFKRPRGRPRKTDAERWRSRARQAGTG